MDIKFSKFFTSFQILTLLFCMSCEELPEFENLDDVEVHNGFYISNKSNLWHFENQIRVCFENGANPFVNPFHAMEMDSVINAIESSWIRYTSLTTHFERLYSCAGLPDKGIYVHIQLDSTPDASADTSGKFGKAVVGVENGVNIPVVFTNNNALGCRPENKFQCIKYFAMHEFGHVLGLEHEHLRDENLNTAGKYDCATFDMAWGTYVNGIPYGPYDKQSIMNYCNTAVILNPKLSIGDIDTIRSLVGDSMSKMENRTDRPGMDIGRYINLTPDGCRKKCAFSKECKSFTWVYPNVQDPSSVCYLKSGYPRPTADGMYSSDCISGTKFPSSNTMLPAVAGLDFPGSDYASFATGLDTSHYSCNNQCAAEARCKAWTWLKDSTNPRKGTCYLKEKSFSDSDAIINANTTSGVKFSYLLQLFKTSPFQKVTLQN